MAFVKQIVTARCTPQIYLNHHHLLQSLELKANNLLQIATLQCPLDLKHLVGSSWLDFTDLSPCHARLVVTESMV